MGDRTNPRAATASPRPPRAIDALGILLGVAVALAGAGCDRLNPPDPRRRGDPVERPVAGGDVDEPAQVQAHAVPIPPDWRGTGVLARRRDVPRGAPDWAAVVAEVVDAEDGRYLRASGRSPPVRTAALAKSAADNRARAELARWLGTERLVGSEVIDTWAPPGPAPQGAMYSRAQIRVPPSWQPGQPLPESWDPRTLSESPVQREGEEDRPESP